MLDILHFSILTLTIIYSWINVRFIRSVNLIIPLLLITLSFEALAEILKIRNVNNLFLFHILTPIEYGFYSLIFIRNIRNKTVKLSILFSIPLVTALCLIFGLYVEGIKSNNSYSGIMSYFLIIIWCLVYLMEVIILDNNKKFKTMPLIWISIGLLFYTSGSLFTQGPLNYLMKKDMHFASIVYAFSYIFTFILFLSILLGAYQSRNYYIRQIN